MFMIQNSRLVATRIASRGMVSRMTFSTDCEAAQKLRDILTQYRQENFSREIPSRFKKEILRPFVGSNGAVEVDSLNVLLTNIGHSQDCLSAKEQAELLQAAGSQNRSIAVNKVMELIN